MRHARTCLAGAFVILLGIAIGCSDDDNGGGNPNVSGRVYNQLENCSQTNTGSAPHCAFADGALQIQFTSLGGGNWEARTVPDTGYLAMGTLNGGTFTYTATHTAGYTEQGALHFNGSGSAYTGSSTYEANNGSFTGECTFNGAIVPNIPPDADPIGACP
jgi:hypothetical protein